MARAEIGIGNSLEAAVVLQAEPDLSRLLERYSAELPSLFIVSRVDLGEAGPEARAAQQVAGLRIGVRRASGEKCDRCWNYTEDRTHEGDCAGLCARCAAAVREIRSGRMA